MSPAANKRAAERDVLGFMQVHCRYLAGACVDEAAGAAGACFFPPFLWVVASIADAVSGADPTVILACIPTVMSESFPATPSAVTFASAVLNVLSTPCFFFVSVIVFAFVSMALTFPPNGLLPLFPANAMLGMAVRIAKANAYEMRVFIVMLNVLLIWIFWFRWQSCHYFDCNVSDSEAFHS